MFKVNVKDIRTTSLTRSVVELLNLNIFYIFP